MKTYTYLAQGNNQAYGVDAYGANEYSCAEGATCTTVEAPNTGFLGTGIPDAAVSTTAAALVVVAALASITYIVVKMVKRHKKARII